MSATFFAESRLPTGAELHVAAPEALIRLSVGVEPGAELIADIDDALNTLEEP